MAKALDEAKPLEVGQDYSITLPNALGIWIDVTDDKGDTMTVRIGNDRVTGMLKLEVYEPGKEDETPVEQILVDF